MSYHDIVFEFSDGSKASYEGTVQGMAGEIEKLRSELARLRPYAEAQISAEPPMDRAEQGRRIGFALGVLTMLQHRVSVDVTRVSSDVTKDQSIGIQKAIDGLMEMWDAPHYVPPTRPL